MQTTLSGSSVMKGRTRHLFWLALVFLLFSVALEYLQAPLIPLLSRSFHSEALPVVLAVIKTLALAGGWFLILLAYALANSVKTYKVLFFVLAAMEIPNAAGLFLSNMFFMQRMTGMDQNRYEFTVFLGAATALNIFKQLAWMACLIIVACSKWSGVALRVAAALFVVHFVVSIIHTLTYQYLFEFLYRQFGLDLYLTINTALNTVLNLFYLAASGFFFVAMSFGKRRMPRGQPPALSA